MKFVLKDVVTKKVTCSRLLQVQVIYYKKGGHAFIISTLY